MKKFTVELSNEQMEAFRLFLVGAILEQKELIKSLQEDSKAPDVEADELKRYERWIAQHEKELEAANIVLDRAYEMEKKR